MLDAVLSERVKKGVMFLNQHVPDWRDRIDPNILDIGNGFACVLGQLFGSYEKGLSALGLTAAQGREYGFEMGSIHRMLPLIYGSGSAYTHLTGLWKVVSGLGMRITKPSKAVRILSAIE